MQFIFDKSSIFAVKSNKNYGRFSLSDSLYTRRYSSKSSTSFVNNEIILSLKYFIVENVRSARRFLKKTLPQIDIDSLTFTEFDEHSKIVDAPKFLEPLRKGFSMGIISEAGCPAIADPGADIVAVAQQEGFSVVPLVGPSSIILSLMASGFNGQKFAFHGYLPIGEPARTTSFPNWKAVFMQMTKRKSLLKHHIGTIALSKKFFIAAVLQPVFVSHQTFPVLTNLFARKQSKNGERKFPTSIRNQLSFCFTNKISLLYNFPTTKSQSYTF